jgi:hypothetical protein
MTFCGEFMEKIELKKRTWHYVQKPYEYEIKCDLCGGTNIEWSEYEGCIWCYTCEKDTKGTGGVFDGPIPVNLAHVLGMSFDRYDMINKKVIKFDLDKRDYVEEPEEKGG